MLAALTSPAFITELRATLRLAAPLALAQLAQIGMGLTDTILLGALGRDALAAGGLGAGLFFTVTAILQGLVMGVGILIAHARGADDLGRVSPLLRGGFLIAAITAIPLMALLWNIEQILLLIGEPQRLAHDVGGYLRILLFATPAAMWLAVQRSYLAAVGKARLVMIVALSALVLNGMLNYGLIHGAWGLPEMGYLGSCTATLIAIWSMFAATATCMRRMQRPPSASRAIDWSIIRELLALGWPISVTMGVEMLLFLVGALMMGILGPTALAAHHVTLSIASTTFMVALAVAQAANVRVGFHMGAQDPYAARRASVAAFLLGVGFMSVAAVAMFAAPYQIALLFNLNPGNANDAEVLALIVRLLFICAFFQIFDGAQTIAAGALRGMKDTRVPALLAGLSYWAVGFPVAWVLAFPLNWGPTGVWWGFAAGLAVAAVVLNTRLWRMSARALGTLHTKRDAHAAADAQRG